MDVDKAVEQATKWLELDGIVGVAQGEHEGKPCITVFTNIPILMLPSKIPSDLDGFPVIVQNIGSVSAL